MTSASVGPAPQLHVEAMDAARERWATRAKPPGALGALEEVAIHLAGVTGCCPPPVPAAPAVAVFAADHGVVADGASAWPPEITAAMVHTISRGGAAINAFARTIGASVTVVDVGVKAALPPLPGIDHRRIRPGTGSIATGPAMTTQDAVAAIRTGAEVATSLVDGGADCLIGGDMGIGNTTASAALIGVLTGRAAREVTGPGAGAPLAGLDHKQRLVAEAMRRAGRPVDSLDLVAQLGGLEIAALAGFYCAAATERVPFIVDGMIAAAALCVADRLAPGTARHAIAGHRSREPAATIALDHLGLAPLLDLELRLGEGTGACLAFPLVAAAARALTDMDPLPGGP